MNDQLINAYYEELDFLRSLSGDFARAHPEIARRLVLSEGVSHDPHVERLIHAVALLNARVRLRIDQDLPLFTDAVLTALYPQYERPIPSLSIAQVRHDASGAPTPEPKGLTRETPLLTEPVGGVRCEFRPAWPVQIWPVAVKEAVLGSTAIAPPECPRPEEAGACLLLTFETLWPDVTFAQLEGLEQLRFYLHDPRTGRSIANTLYEMLLVRSLGAYAVSDHSPQGSPAAAPVPVRAISPSRDEELFPGDERSHRAYRLMLEFFAFPERYRFFDIELDPAILARTGRVLRLAVFLTEADPEIERRVTPEVFRLGCFPVINLFPIPNPDPLTMGETTLQSRVVPDRRRENALEVYSIDRVRVPERKESPEIPPLHELGHADPSIKLFWQSRREIRPLGATEEHVSEVSLSIVDRTVQPAPAPKTLRLELTCFNRNLPEKLPFGPGAPKVSLAEGGSLTVDFLIKPTKARRPMLGRDAISRLLSHLTVNHLSIVDHERGAEALRELLDVYRLFGESSAAECIGAISSVTSARETMRVDGGIAPGITITLTLNPRRVPSDMACLFGAVLEQFFSLYTSVNTYTRLRLVLAGQSKPLHQWPARAGDRTLL